MDGTAYTPPGGTLVMLEGDDDLVSPVTLSEPMTIRGLGGVAAIHP